MLSVYKLYIRMNQSTKQVTPTLKICGVLVPVLIIVVTIILNTAFR